MRFAVNLTWLVVLLALRISNRAIEHKSSAALGDFSLSYKDVNNFSTRSKKKCYIDSQA